MNWFYRLLARGESAAVEAEGKVEHSPFDTPVVYNGYLASAAERDTSCKGTVRVQLERAVGCEDARAEVKLELAGHHAWSMSGVFKMNASGRGGVISFEEKKSLRLELEIEDEEMKGKFLYKPFGTAKVARGYFIMGARDVFESGKEEDRVRGEACFRRWKGNVLLAWKSDPYVDKEEGEKLPRFAGWNSYSIVMGARGRVQVSGTRVDGKKMETSADIICMKGGACVVPVVINKAEGAHSFLLVVTETEELAVKGLKDVHVGWGERLQASAIQFELEEGYPLWNQLGDGFSYTEYLPMHFEVRIDTAGKWVLPKAGKVGLNQYGQVSHRKLGENPAALLLDYNAADGTFKGTFNAYVNKHGWPKPFGVQVNGVILGKTGYGTASVKGFGSVPVILHVQATKSPQARQISRE